MVGAFEDAPLRAEDQDFAIGGMNRDALDEVVIQPRILNAPVAARVMGDVEAADIATQVDYFGIARIASNRLNPATTTGTNVRPCDAVSRERTTLPSRTTARNQENPRMPIALGRESSAAQTAISAWIIPPHSFVAAKAPRCMPLSLHLDCAPKNPRDRDAFRTAASHGETTETIDAFRRFSFSV